MFSGIIEAKGIVDKIEADGTNLHFTIKSDISSETYIDQSISHNGVCLTVIEKGDNTHKVTAIKETLDLTNLSELRVGNEINLERSIKLETLLDGHMVQGHVDTTGICREISILDGSWYFKFEIDPENQALLVPKGSISINGVSLTVVEPNSDNFQVAIIPFTFEHTNFKTIKIGDKVNLEFDVIGKYVKRYMDSIHRNNH